MSNQFKEPRLHIATIGKTVGIKGEMKFHDHSDFPEQFQKNTTFLTNKNSSLTLSEVNHEKGLIKIAGVNSVEDAKKFTNIKLYTTREETRKNCRLEDGEYFWFDLEGCGVYENGKLLGLVDEVQRITISNYLFVKTSKELLDAGHVKSFLIPFHKPFVISTDIDKKIIVVDGAVDILEAS
ncbi:ribosome maturation factor RimM [Sulfurimonas hongkongensis]|uniref:Ribosome maturation factor RimM n=2 Tax=Sulfurimonas hongkongensis TaxID=1172190 RepID=T0JS40_9BACT|nr:ribosome maturation factor RimM [Sulfurimonas hongkongensis]